MTGSIGSYGLVSFLLGCVGTAALSLWWFTNPASLPLFHDLFLYLACLCNFHFLEFFWMAHVHSPPYILSNPDRTQ
jgi:hypothetical protein